MGVVCIGEMFEVECLEDFGVWGYGVGLEERVEGLWGCDGLMEGFRR